MRLAVDGHRGAEPRVDAGEGPREAVFLDLREHVRDGACLVTQGVPIGLVDLDADVEHMIEGEIAVARTGLGVDLSHCGGSGGGRGTIGGERRGRANTVFGCARAADRDQRRCDKHGDDVASASRPCPHSSSLLASMRCERTISAGLIGYRSQSASLSPGAP